MLFINLLELISISIHNIDVWTATKIVERKYVICNSIITGDDFLVIVPKTCINIKQIMDNTFILSIKGKFEKWKSVFVESKYVDDETEITENDGMETYMALTLPEDEHRRSKPHELKIRTMLSMMPITPEDVWDGIQLKRKQ